MTERIESVIFEAIIGDDDFCRKTLHHLHADYYSDHVDRVLIKEIKRFYDEHNKAPTKRILKLFAEDCSEFKQDEYTKAIELVDSLETPEGNKEWLIKRTEQFCQEKSIYNAIMSSIQIMEGKNTKYGKDAIPGLLSDALSVSFDKTIGHDFFADAEKRFDFYHLKEDRIPFDLEMFNKITKGGLPSKTLNAVLAGTNTGKSLFLCHHAASILKQGKNALYITLEMAEERIAERIDCNILNVSIDELHRMKREDYSSRIEALQSKNHGRLIVKEYPTGGAHVGHFKSLLDELKLKKNFVPDVVYIDYINICASQKYSSQNYNSYFAIKATAEELRGMAVEFDVPILTATQTTRNGSTDSDIDMTATSECIETSQPVTLRNGETKAIGDIQVGEQITANDNYKTVMVVHHKKMKDCFKITLKSGKSIVVSADHVFPTNRGRISINSGNLTTGDLLSSVVGENQ